MKTLESKIIKLEEKVAVLKANNVTLCKILNTELERSMAERTDLRNLRDDNEYKIQTLQNKIYALEYKLQD